MRLEQNKKNPLAFESRQKKQTLFVCLIIITAASFVIGITNTIFFISTDPTMSFVLFGCSIISLLAVWLNYNNCITAASVIALSIVYIVVFFNLFFDGGLRDPGIIAVPIAIIFGGMIFGKKAILWMTIATIIPLLLLSYIEIGLNLTPPYTPPSLNTAIVMIVITAAAGFIIFVIMNNHEAMLRRIQNNIKEMEISEERYRTIFNTANDAIFIHDIDTGKILDVNERMCEMYGYSYNEAIKLSMEDISSGEEPYTQQQAAKYIKQANKTPQLFEWQAKDKQGKLFLVEVNMRVTQLLEESRLLVLARDIDDRKKAEEQLIHAQKLQTIGMLSSGIAHDFNNSLTGITASASFLKTLILSDKETDKNILIENIDIIEKSADHLGDIVKQLLMFSRKDKVVFGPVDLAHSIDSVLKIIQSSLKDNITIIWKNPEDPAVTYGNNTQIQQVLINLCINAIHAMTIMRAEYEKQEGTLTIHISEASFRETITYSLDISPHGKYWKISIMDTGIGMDKDTIAKIFDPFFSTKNKTGGTGLGLAMVQSILMRHAAYISVESERGKGSEFSLFFPATLP